MVGFKVCYVIVLIDLLTVSETSKEPPQDEEGINTFSNLAVEATYINQNFSQQMLLVRMCFVRSMIANL